MEAVKNNITTWNPSLYDDKHAFVFKYGEDLVSLLNPQAGERILDLGCGTGYLADLIAQSGATVTGIDNSAEMIEKARKTYPGIEFDVLSATDFRFEKPFNAIFSNAALHWVLDKEKAVACIYDNLETGGRLVLEMGGKDNVDSIIRASRKVLARHDYAENANFNIWYFPSLSEYTTLLEQEGFRVTYASHYDRETELKNNANGIKDWIKMFGSSFLKGIPEQELDEILDEIQETLRPTNYCNQTWWADYKRLRIVAIKQSLK